MGVTIVGPSGSGKSTLRKLLLRVSQCYNYKLIFIYLWHARLVSLLKQLYYFQALNKTNHSVTQHVFNPKAMTRAQLLGQIDLDTRQWTDGVLTLCALQVYAEPTGKQVAASL